MARKKAPGTGVEAQAAVTIRPELLEQLVPGPMTPEGLEAVFRGFKKAFLERALNAEGAKFWLRVFTDLRSRGVNDILLGVADGLKGLPEALETALPRTTLQTCIVHLIRHSLGYVPWRERKAMASLLRPIYTAPSAEVAEAALQALEDSPLGQRYATVAPAWRRAWTHVVPFFAFPPEVRRMVYTTNAIESVHARLRKVIKTRGHFPTDEAATKLIWLALRNIRTVWNKPPIHWTAAMNQFAILFGDRIERAVP